MRPEHFFSTFSPNIPDEGSILCIGLSLEEPQEWIEACRTLITPAEWEETQRYAHAADAARHAAGRAVVRTVMRAEGCPDAMQDFHLSRYGKPHCALSSLHFSLSHSGPQIWAALCCDVPAGIDTEAAGKRHSILRIAEKLHPLEREALHRLPPEEQQAAFLRCWTRKEAVMKALGTGLSIGLDSFCVSTDAAESGFLLSLPHGIPADADISPTALPAPDGWTCRTFRTADDQYVSVSAPKAGMRTEVQFLR